jgi:uncharacterized cofD-like protein
MKKKKVVVIGGGTGTIPVLTGLKQFNDLDISVIVSMTDDGGSNAVIRDEFGLLPLSDLRKSIIALSQTNNKLLRDIFTYRFSKGEGLAGHTLGNLILMGLSEIAGSEQAATKAVSDLFNVQGQVIPVTLEHATLVAEYTDGTRIEGEHVIDEPEDLRPKAHIQHLLLVPEARANIEAVRAIQEADVIIAGPGDLNTSTLANIIVRGIPEALQKNKGIFVFISNLMTKLGQTHGFKASDHLKELTKYTGRAPDMVVVNKGVFNDTILTKYHSRGEKPVEDDLDGLSGSKVIRASVVDFHEEVQQKGDTLVRSLIRHDAKKLAQVLKKIIFNIPN